MLTSIDPTIVEAISFLPAIFLLNSSVGSMLKHILHVELLKGIPTDPLPPLIGRSSNVPHAPTRWCRLNEEEQKLAVQNALRYFPKSVHAVLAPEFLNELKTYGHIYMYRFKPSEYEMRAYPITDYPAKTHQAAAIILQIMNNLDPRVAQYPEEMVTYGGNGSVFSNWAQYHLVIKYLCDMDTRQTLVLHSGHPLGLFPSHEDAPRLVVTNGMVVWNYSTRGDYDRLYALGVTQYGQMTAGSFCYIGPQGIVHGTTITLLNAARRYLNTSDLRGIIFVSSGLGGMSGAQPKAAVMCGAIAVIAEINPSALEKRQAQGWIQKVEYSLDGVIQQIREAREKKEAVSIGYLGNIVDIWERLAEEPELLVNLGSDQTSLHNPYSGGYYPVDLTFEESNHMMFENPKKFQAKVKESLIRQVNAINTLAARGMKFYDYGNSFLLEASRAGCDILDQSQEQQTKRSKSDQFNDSNDVNHSQASSLKFRYPSYVEDIMGDIFAFGFGPFRWICSSLDHQDLLLTDDIARQVLKEFSNDPAVKQPVKDQYLDNLWWMNHVEEHKLVVGSEARILYSNAAGRVEIACRINKAIRDGTLKAPVILSRDHHDVSGTDSPWRETSDIKDGSKFCADMAVQNCIGDAFRGATSVSLHNGGGTGWGESVNGGFLLVLDGTQSAEQKARRMLAWDVNHGIARRSWCGNKNALSQIQDAMDEDAQLKITIPFEVDSDILANLEYM